MSHRSAFRRRPSGFAAQGPADRTRPVAGWSRPGRGYTVVELMVGLAILSLLATIALAAYQTYREKAQADAAVSDIAMASIVIDQYRTEHGVSPPSLAAAGLGNPLDPWGNPYQYLSHDDPKAKGQWRKDHNVVPINSDYDLWSMGKDGKSSPPLTAKPSRDDIIRASNGRFVGLASEFDP
jgi:general secretion pathway protein G